MPATKPFGGCYICPECRTQLGLDNERPVWSAVGKCEAHGYGRGDWSVHTFVSFTWAYAPRSHPAERDRLRADLERLTQCQL